MIIFDLREEARMASYLYGIGSATILLMLAAAIPDRIRNRLPSALAESLRPLAGAFLLATIVLAWFEYSERQEADRLAELCLSGACAVTEGPATSVDPIHKITSGSRWTAPIEGGYFQVGDTVFAHYPRDHSDYSPITFLRQGQMVRVYSKDQVLVLVEVID